MNAKEEIQKINNYPEDIFIPLTNKDLRLRIDALSCMNLSADQEAGHLMRIAEKNTKYKCLEILKDAADFIELNAFGGVVELELVRKVLGVKL